MTTPLAQTWLERNQRYLSGALDKLRRDLLARLEGPATELTASAELSELTPCMPAPPALVALGEAFGLSSFEREVLLLAAAPELDSSFAQLYAKLQGDALKTYPTFSVALAALPDPHWSALSPEGPLRRWRLVEVGAGNAMATSPLRIDERVLHYLAGVHYIDERLAGFVRPVPASVELVPSHQSLAEELAATLRDVPHQRSFPVIQLCGHDGASRQTVAAAACALLGLHLYMLPAVAIPLDPREQHALVRLWEREAALSRGVLLLECGEIDTSDPIREAAILRLLEDMRGVLIVAGRDPRSTLSRPLVTLEVGRPAAIEQRACWERALGSAAASLNGGLEALVSQFSLSAPTIEAACAQALGRAAAGDERPEEEGPDLGTTLWEACREQARPRLENLAQRIESAAKWEDLVLPEVSKQILREIAVHVRQRQRVYESWGFAAKSSRGLGISALFVGTSGTGKTMAAEVLANELRLDLYHIDLSQVVSKYIGETEKNLRRVFDAAQDGGAILLFDEADALFGKRSEVKDSHDRYANIEVSYLLQRMEAYRGLAILTTNMKSALDPGFMRRIRFVVQFPFPDVAQRAEIWRRIFPAATPTEGLDVSKLARLNVAGGNIRNIALYAAFLAAEAGERVRMAYLLRAAQVEYAKLERPLSEAEIGGWA